MSEHQHKQNCHGMDEYTNTEMIVREDILTKARELAGLLSTSSEVEFFQQAEKQISNNDHIQTLISAIKKKQKEIVAFERFENQAMINKIEGEIDSLQDELDSIPIVSEFKQSQEDINYLLQLIMSVIRDTLSETITVEKGTAAVSSCD
ncbi:YlbF family regulator [Paenibacillus filicis]|uniref:YlbF family regulator n=1 Tax=Paenibacillus gyeongsangnamensis TaxID=3388067 RepID=A0ABT4Q5X9_9BACL|nr:YlbF family regulator [Paenibacillus filicis]MCZ8512284.1 YlbF family regulator [Paenibacillus filicis]